VSPRPARLLFVCGRLGGGGAERWVSTVLGQLDRARFAPELCLLRREIDYPLPEDVPLFALGRRGRLGLAPAVVRLARLVERRRPDLLLSAFAGPSFAAGNALVLVRHRPRWVARVSSDPDLTEPGLLLRGWMRALYRRADRLLANAQGLCERVERVYAPPGGVGRVPNAVDFAALDALAREPAPEAPAGRLRVISVGRLEPVKRFGLLIDAVARLRGRLDLELVILGEGGERRRLEARARRLGLSERVLLPGFASNPYAWLARSDLFALVSASEGLPNALIEAQGLGLAALASQGAGGAAEIVQDGASGRLVAGDDARVLAEALAELLGDAERRRAFGRRGREWVRARFAAAPATRALEAQLAALSSG
jgi:glycosyltransferase involved in cell wall biosynthesis